VPVDTLIFLVRIVNSLVTVVCVLLTCHVLVFWAWSAIQLSDWMW